MRSRSVEFFEEQFRRQIAAGELALNPFEQRALEHLAGDVLDLGCGLGNLALEAARRGHRVLAVDASPAAIAHVGAVAARERLPLRAREVDLASWEIDRSSTTIVCIGLLMFFPRERALALLADVQRRVEPGGIAVVNVLVEGTTFLDMFQPGAYTLFGRTELERSFAGWTIRSAVEESFPAPGNTRKVFTTVVAARPGHAPGLSTEDSARFGR